MPVFKFGVGGVVKFAGSVAVAAERAADADGVEDMVLALVVCSSRRGGRRASLRYFGD